MEIIASKDAPKAIGPYSQAVRAGDFLYLSGQSGLRPEGGKAGDTLEEQAERTMQNIQAVLKEAGTDFSHVVKTTCFLADIGDFAAFNEIYARYFVSKPARSCFAVRELPLGMLCEVEVVAYLGE